MAPKKRPAAQIESQISISGGSYIKELLKGTKQESPMGIFMDLFIALLSGQSKIWSQCDYKSLKELPFVFTI